MAALTFEALRRSAEHERDAVARQLGANEQNLARVIRGDRFDPVPRTDHPGRFYESSTEIEEVLRARVRDLRSRYNVLNARVAWAAGLINMPPAIRDQLMRQRVEQEENRLRATGPTTPTVSPEQQRVMDAQEARRQEMLAEQAANRRKAGR